MSNPQSATASPVKPVAARTSDTPQRHATEGGDRELLRQLSHDGRNALQRSHASLERLALRLQDRPDALAILKEIQLAQREVLEFYERVQDCSLGSCVVPVVGEAREKSGDELARIAASAVAPLGGSLRIAVADDELSVLEYYQEILTVMGHQVIAVARTGRELLSHCRALRPDMVITDIKMPDMDGIDAATEICGERPIPVILVSAFHDPELVERAAADHIMAYLVKPTHRDHLEPAIAIAVQRFHQFQAVCQEAVDLSQALKDRKLIERAKGSLMKQSGLDEESAFRRMQKLARDKNLKMVDIAEIILAAEDFTKSPERRRRSGT